MKKTIRIFIFSAALLLFVSKNLLHYSTILINISTDILAVPFFLVVIEVCMKFLYGPKFGMTLLHIALTFLMISIFFEAVLPLKYPYMTADPLDVIWYLTGTVLFTCFRKNFYRALPA
jgi:hypothetical protein